ncbi:M1 family metallopeptidase [Paludibaculum fermentans]|uniref:Aminopeptidase N n=1 Tax=Paludibaculum fermentans TaxID=1473598 RepID=A0A7S7NL29_PALFE|nr:M1 family aminopeptidase [Paludibaculum fermentans]QOY85616.1 HEAT repeat domain-containing protein [Paludibaculum fermentans]
MIRAWLVLAASLVADNPPQQFERSRDYDVQHYRIELRLDEKTHSFQGSTRISLQPLKDAFTLCELDAETFTVLGVKDAEGPLRFEQGPGKLAVHLPRPYQYREAVSFTVAYEARGVKVDPEKYGMQKEYDLGLNFKDETQEHPAVINTLSFPEGARHWFPSNDQPNDKATSEVIATVRADYEVVSNGRLLETTRSGNTRTFHWSQEQPHSTYLFVLAAGPYVRVPDGGGPLPISYWVYPKDEKNATRSFGRTREIIQFFEREYGVPFPWAKYDQVTIPGIGGGAESTSATVVSDGTIHDEKADKDYPSHWLVAHEAAHQWWGDLVTMRGWSETWINESFATYGEYLYSKHSLGEDEGALNLALKRNRYLEEARTKYRRPIVSDRWTTPNQNFDRHTYEKGAAVLHMLRWSMGDREFQRATAHFLKKHSFQAADTHDLLIAIREATGQVQDSFFEQWIYQAGHPVFEVRWAWLEGEGAVELTVVQKQAPLFSTPVDIGVTTGSGKKVERLQIGKRDRQVFRIACASRPRLVRFDEGNHLLMEMEFPKEVEELEYQLEHDDAMGRMWAASQLKGKGAEAALRKAAHSDPFWAVRREALQALEGNAAFFSECVKDPKPGVRAAAIKRLAALKDCGLMAERFRAEDSYAVQAEALRAMGSCGDRSQLPLLKEAAAMESPGQVLRRAAQSALGVLGER